MTTATTPPPATGAPTVPPTNSQNWSGKQDPTRNAWLRDQRSQFLQGGGTQQQWQDQARGQAWRQYNTTMDPNNPNVGQPAPPTEPPTGGGNQGQPWEGYGSGNPMGGAGDWMNQYMSMGGGGGYNPGMGQRPGPVDIPGYENQQKYVDQLYEEQMRLADPHMENMRKRHEQDLINKGIDPNSEQGQQMLQNMQGGVNDLQQRASAASIGQGMQYQNQLAQQYLGGRGQDAQMYGAELGAGTQRYLGDQAHMRGMGQLGLAGQGQDFNQMMALEGLGFRDRQYADSQDRYQDQLLMSLLGQNPMQGATPIDGMGAWQANSQADRGMLGKLGM